MIVLSESERERVGQAGVGGPIALFLDIDGTLLDVAPTPDGVVVPPGLVATLTRVRDDLEGAVALVTGRPLAEVDWFFSPLKLIAAGVHGTEMRLEPGGEISAVAGVIDPDLANALKSVPTFHSGVFVEIKNAGAAVHYRKVPEAETALSKTLAEIMLGYSGRYKLTRGRKIFEVVSTHHSKGTAVEALARLPVMQGRRIIFIGDDVSDEPALAAAERLGGVGWKVAGEHFAPGNARFSGPADVRQWLSDTAFRGAIKAAAFS